jgi:hypothetical protein
VSRKVRFTTAGAAQIQTPVLVLTSSAKGTHTRPAFLALGNTDIVERYESAAREGGFALNLAPKDQQIRLRQRVVSPISIP